MKAKRFSLLPLQALLLLLSLSFTSCLEFTEYYKINRDGSGSYALDLDMSKMFEALEQFTAMSGGGEDMDQMFDSLVIGIQDEMNAKKKQGLISDYQLQADPEKRTVHLTHNFSDIAALSQAVRSETAGDDQLTQMLGGNQMIPAVMSLRKNIFFKDVTESKGDRFTEEERQQMQSMRQFFTGFSMTMVFEFEQTVKKAKGPAVTVSSDKHKVIQQFDLDDILDETALADLTVKLK